MNSAVVYIDGYGSDRQQRAMQVVAGKVQRAHQVLAQSVPLDPQDDPFASLEQGALLYLGLDHSASQPCSTAMQVQRTLLALRNTFAARRKQALTVPLRPLMVVLDECCLQSGQMAPEVVALAADAVCVGVTVVISDRFANYDLPELDALVDCHVYQRMEEPQYLPTPCRERLGLRLPNLLELRDFMEGIGVVCVRSEPPGKARLRPARTSLAYTRVDLNAE